MTAPPALSRFAPKRNSGKGKLKLIPIPGVGKGPRWLHLPEPDVMPVYLFQAVGAASWMVLTPTDRHGPFETIEAALTCWSVEARKA